MAGMGSTGKVNIKVEMMTNAKKAIEEYRSEISGLNTELDGVVSGLIPSGFSGSAASGFQVYYTNNVQKNLGNEGLLKMLDALTQICDTIEKQIPGGEGVDEQLGNGNKGTSAE